MYIDDIIRRIGFKSVIDHIGIYAFISDAWDWIIINICYYSKHIFGKEKTRTQTNQNPKACFLHIL